MSTFICTITSTVQVKTPRRERREQNAEEEEDDDDDSEDDDITTCEVCNRADREHVLLLCDGFVCVMLVEITCTQLRRWLPY